jgi:hypothetical protein
MKSYCLGERYSTFVADCRDEDVVEGHTAENGTNLCQGSHSEYKTLKPLLKLTCKSAILKVSKYKKISIMFALAL